MDVLITGGTGYLGRALVRAMLEDPSILRICVYSRGEYAQALMRQATPDPEGRIRWFIGDVRDLGRLRRAMEGVGLVIHTAALKRVEVGEYNPTEMVATNVLGAMNVIEAAQAASVKRVVAVSSDKACQPLNCYGATKLVMEKLMLAANQSSGAQGPRFACVRYGNVAGSTGSVIPIWRDLLAKGATTLPVRNPVCRRFWLHIREAVELVRWTLTHMVGGELVVPLMPAYRIADLAEAMDAAVELTEIGAGEKLDEMMIAPMESASFRHIPPYLVSGGMALDHPVANIGGIKTHMLSVDDLREMLKEIE